VALVYDHFKVYKNNNILKIILLLFFFIATGKIVTALCSNNL